MTSKLVWTAVSLALIGLLISAAPDLKRYIKISTM
ncbi:MAG: hypothetical protein JWO91_2938 [Acidobacteriaceae bacterium]|nr:hypothetical protein [Acidobacteriaceae bacterium]